MKILEQLQSHKKQINIILSIINEIDSFKKAYKAVTADKRTQGTFRTNIENKLLPKADKYHAQFVSLSNQLERAINRSALAYAIALYNNSTNVANAADGLNTQA